MARQIHERDISPVLAAADEWIRNCLVEDRSVFSQAFLWTAVLVEEVRYVFVDHPDTGSDDFMTKLKGQMKKASPEAQQLMAEMLWALLLFPSNIRAGTKRQQVRDVWALSGQPLPEDHPLLRDEVLVGVGSGGTGFNNYRPEELAFFIALVADLKRRSIDHRRKIFAEYNDFMIWVDSVEREGSRQYRHMLRYFAFPDQVERISSNNDRRRILEAFGVAPARDLKNWTDRQLDDALLKLRTGLEGNSPANVLDFYQPDLKERWSPDRQVETVEREVTAALAGDQDAEKAAETRARTVDEDIRGKITREDILEAISTLDRGEAHAFGPSTFYDLLEGGRRYPPKAVVGIAARRALGRPLRPDEFAGGQGSWAFRLLRARGFTIVDKEQIAGQPGLPTVPAQRIWIEDTKTAEHGHGGVGWEFGSCLWSPSANERGADQYALMREPKTGDLVIHINDGSLTGWSYVSVPFREIAKSPPSPGQWGGRPGYYRIELKNYTEFPISVSLKEFVEENRVAIQEELKKDSPKRYPFILYGEKEEIRHAQGAYLTRCTPKLYGLIKTAVFRATDGAVAQSTTRRYWAMALGEGGRIWDECQEKGIAAIGWHEYELGDLTNYGSRDSIQRVLIERRRTPGPTPSNDALCLFQFSHEMASGDFIVAKVGRRRLLGIGVVTSEYFLDEERVEYQHCRRVRWLSSHGVELPESLSLSTKTLTDITDYEDLITFVNDQYFESHITPPSLTGATYSIQQAQQALFMPPSQLLNIVTALKRKKNVILQGPPGVGKTFAARHIAFALIGELDHSRIEMIQFHQSYAYEDFIQGWRPKQEGGFRLKNGIFVEFCNRARIDPTRKYVFIIDEINRGNLSKIFGELMMLIEADKRGAKNAIPLTYSESNGERFSVPENVYLLGLMNTADRSLALVDYALRRRFVFFSLAPALESDQFAAQLTKAGGSTELVQAIRRCIGALNQKIAADRDLGEGFLIGHSFFCPKDGDQPISDDWYRDIVDTEVVPLIREYWFDKKQTEMHAIIQQLRETA